MHGSRAFYESNELVHARKHSLALPLPWELQGEHDDISSRDGTPLPETPLVLKDETGPTNLERWRVITGAPPPPTRELGAKRAQLLSQCEVYYTDEELCALALTVNEDDDFFDEHDISTRCPPPKTVDMLTIFIHI